MTFPLPGSFYEHLIGVANYLSEIKCSLNDPFTIFPACEYLLSCYCMSYPRTLTTFDKNALWGRALVSKFIVILYQSWLPWALKEKLDLSHMEV